MMGVPSTRRPNQGNQLFKVVTATCMSPMANTTLMAATMEWSSPSTAAIKAPPNRNSTTMSNGAIMLAIRRPISRTANSSTK